MLFQQLTKQAKLVTSFYQDANFTGLYESLDLLHGAINQESLEHPLELPILLNIELAELSYVQNLLVKSTLLINLIAQVNKLNYASRQSLATAAALAVLEISKHRKYLASGAGIELINQNIEKFALKTVKQHKNNKHLHVDVISILCLLANLKSNRWQLRLEQDTIKLCIHLLFSSFGTSKATRIPLFQVLAGYGQTTSLDVGLIESQLRMVFYSGLLGFNKTQDCVSVLTIKNELLLSIPYDKQNHAWADTLVEQPHKDIDYLKANYPLSILELNKIASYREQQQIDSANVEFSQQDNRVLPVSGFFNGQIALLEQDRQDKLFSQVSDSSDIGILVRETVSMLMVTTKDITSLKHAFAISGASNFSNVFISSSLIALFKQDKYLGQVTLEGILKLATKINLNLVKLLKQEKALELDLVITVLLLTLITVPKVRFAMISYKYQEIGTLHQFFAETDLSKLKQLSLNIAKRWGCSAEVLYKLQNFYRCNESASYKIKLSMNEEKAVNQIELALSLIFDFLSGQTEPHFFHLSQLIELDIPQEINPDDFYQSLIAKVNPFCPLV